MSKISLIGYPRFGKNRELKKIVEAYFKGLKNEEELMAETDNLKIEQWKFLKSKNIDFIPSNDFSYYDNMLDMMFIFNVIPEKYNNLNLSFLEKYFAIARGYQKGNIDLKPFKMRKWFNTNYHYIVPRIDESVKFKLNKEYFLYDYKLALKNSIKSKITIIGPFSFLKLSDIYNSKNFSYLLEELSEHYVELIKLCEKENIEFLQIEEPYLVTDLKRKDINNFIKAYKIILNKSNNVKVILQTYFGDIRDIYKNIVKLPFWGIGLDFIEGKYNLKLIKKYSFPTEKKLFAGIVNGRNIWKNNYKDSLKILTQLKNLISEDNIYISPSSSFLHIPYTVKNELNIPDKVKQFLSFAEEKIEELNDLKYLFKSKDYENEPLFIRNQKIINSREKLREFIYSDIREKVKNIKKYDLVRKTKFNKRIKIQKKLLNLSYLPTTTIGSFPQTEEIRRMRKKFKKRDISEVEYESFIKKKIKEVIRFQEDINLDVLVHGEFERNDMVEYFAENLEGFIFTENGWVQSYGTRGVKPPIIFGDIKWEKPITVKWITYAQSLTDKPVKGILTGPVTILNWSFPREDIPLRDIAFQIAIAMKNEVKTLVDAGIKIIQVDEAALREKLPLRKKFWRKKYLNWAIDAFRFVHSSLPPEVQLHTHMCYSNFSDIIKEIDKMDADVITIEAARSDLSILDSFVKYKYKKDIGPGVYDIHSPRIPSVNEIGELIDKIIKKLGYKHLWINPDCGLKTRTFTEISSSLKNMVEATNMLRKKYKLKD